jgi:hypothetical protein
VRTVSHPQVIFLPLVECEETGDVGLERGDEGGGYGGVGEVEKPDVDEGVAQLRDEMWFGLRR